MILDCGSNPDAWQDTVLQVEDIPAKDDRPMMTAGKFRSILAQVDKKVRLDHDVRLTIEIGRPSEAMQVFDVAALSIKEGRVLLSLGVRAAHLQTATSRWAGGCGSLMLRAC